MDGRIQYMEPVTFNGCFGWLHTSLSGTRTDVAVLICPGLNRDALDSHHSLRLLADAFAAAGYPAMRFDYPGTGDSCDIERGEPWTIWQQSVHEAADWLRSSTGARRLIFCGLRVGATLATLAVERRDDAAALLLLAPVLRGHSYMLQLCTEAWMLSGSAVTMGQSFDLYGLRFSAETVGLIRQVDLRQAKLKAGHHVMIFSQSASSLLTACVQAWAQRGAEVGCAGFDGLEPILRYNLKEEGPPADFSAVIDWVLRSVPSQPILLPNTALPSPALLQPPGCTEIPLRFGADKRLFGILCRPHGTALDQVVIIGNAGRDPRYGTTRFGVEFARHLAAEGIASLRMDFAGLGDSIGAAGEEDVMSFAFETDRVSDINAAVDALERLGYRQYAMQGSCSGAYHALHGALADPRIKTLLLINMPMFTLRSGETVEFRMHKGFSLNHYLLKLVHKNTWSRLMQGKLDFSCILRAQHERLYERVRKRLHLRQQLAHIGSQDFARRAMATLSRRRTRTLFLFAPGDEGVQTLEQVFGPGSAGLRAFDGASMQIVPGLDHNLSGRLMRRTTADLMVTFLSALPDPSDQIAR